MWSRDRVGKVAKSGGHDPRQAAAVVESSTSSPRLAALRRARGRSTKPAAASGRLVQIGLCLEGQEKAGAPMRLII